MNHFWKIATVLLFILCIGMGYMLYKAKSNELKINQMSLNDIDREAYEYKKKQDPSMAKDLNDFFYKNQTSIRFLQDLYDFDTVMKGNDIRREIKFINTGMHPFFITDLKVSCGCTIPTYKKEPIKPNDTGMISVEFKSATKDGFVMNKLTVHGNVETNEKSTYFKVYVKEKKP